MTINQRNKLRSGTARVDARLLLVALDHIASQGGVGNPELQDVTGLSRASVHRLIANAQDQYGVKVTYKRYSFAESGEYTIDDWGVFDHQKVRAYLRRNND